MENTNVNINNYPERFRYKSSLVHRMTFGKRGGATVSVVPHIVVADLNNREILFMHGSVQDNKFSLLEEYLNTSKHGTIATVYSNNRNKETETLSDDSVFLRYRNRSFQGLTEMGSKPYIFEKDSLDDIITFTATSENISPNPILITEFRKEQEKRATLNSEPFNRVPKNIRFLAMCWNSSEGDVYDELYNVIYNNYSTPFVKEWTPYIVDKLISLNLIRECGVMTYTNSNKIDLRAFLLEFSTHQLQSIISEGVKNLEIEFFEYDDIDEFSNNDESKLAETRTVTDYMTKFGAELAKIIQDSVEIRFDPTKERHHPSLTELNLHANNQGVTGYYPPQANTIMGVAKTLKESDFCFVNGEMGKTLPSIGESR